MSILETQTTPTKTPPALRMTASGFYMAKHDPNGNPSHRTEDCHLIYHEPDGHGATAIGVADGVGGYKNKGIDSGEYSEELMMNAAAALHLHYSSDSDSDVDPLKILKSAHSQTKKPGGSTACIVALVGDELRFANVGDSGMKVFRKNSVVYESPIQILGFNYPAQLDASSRKKSKKEKPVEGRVKVEAGDVVVAGTDGLFDNLHSWEIERIVEEGGDLGAEDLALAIGLAAFENSMDVTYDSPFARECQKHGKAFQGGKRDDITVVVGRIQPLPDFAGQYS
ncbi:Probable protein phosphatase 2C 80 [Linum grandiflorum]